MGLARVPRPATVLLGMKGKRASVGVKHFILPCLLVCLLLLLFRDLLYCRAVLASLEKRTISLSTSLLWRIDSNTTKSGIDEPTLLFLLRALDW